MDKDSILVSIKSICEDQFDETVELETDIRDGLGADSLDVVELIMNVEREHNISIPDDKADDIKTISNMVDVVHDIINK